MGQSRDSKKDAYDQYESAAKESINDNPDTFKPKTMDIVLKKIELLEIETAGIKEETAEIKTAVDELHDHIMPNAKMDWPGMYIAIKDLATIIAVLKTMQETQIKKAEYQDKKIARIDEELQKNKKDIQTLQQENLIKAEAKKAVSNDEAKRVGKFELKLKWIAGIATLIALMGWLKDFILFYFKTK